MRAREAPAALWDQYGLNLPVDLKGLAEALGIEVVSFRWKVSILWSGN